MLKTVKKLFGTKDLLEVLNISKKSAGYEKQLRSAYLRAALRFHPDKCTDDKDSTSKFQIIQKIYEVLKDDDMRKSYEEAGEWPEDEAADFDIASFGRLDENAILEFKKIYIGSEEERESIKTLYIEGEGSIFHIVEHLFFANILTDEERIQSVIDDLIEKKEMEILTKGVVSQKIRDRKINKAKKEAKEAEVALKALGVGPGLDSLSQAIMKRQAQRNDNFLDELERKYGGLEKEAKRKGSKSATDEATLPKKSKSEQPSGSKKSSKTKSRSSKSASKK